MSHTPRVLRPIGGTILVALIGALFYLVAIAAMQSFFTTPGAVSAAYSATTKLTTLANERAAAKAASTTQLQSIVASTTMNYGSNVGLVLVDLSNDATASANADTQFVSASIYKLFVAYGVYSRIDEGSISLGDTMTKYGISSTVGECLDAMLTISDNACGVALGQLYGWSSLDLMLASEGYSGTQLDNYDSSGNLDSDKLTTANDVTKLLQKLYDGSLLSTLSTEQFIALLKADEINYMLPSGLPDGTVIAHKVGYLADYQHDAGIIYSPDGDMLVVMLTKGWANPTSDATAAFTLLGQSVSSYMTM